jgi:hypothetical protein
VCLTPANDDMAMRADTVRFCVCRTLTPDHLPCRLCTTGMLAVFWAPGGNDVLMTQTRNGLVNFWQLADGRELSRLLATSPSQLRWLVRAALKGSFTSRTLIESRRGRGNVLGMAIAGSPC